MEGLGDQSSKLILHLHFMAQGPGVAVVDFPSSTLTKLTMDSKGVTTKIYELLAYFAALHSNADLFVFQSWQV